MSSKNNKAALGISAKPTLTQRLSTNSQCYMGTPGHSRPPASPQSSLPKVPFFANTPCFTASPATYTPQINLTATAALNLTSIIEWIDYFLSTAAAPDAMLPIKTQLILPADDPNQHCSPTADG